MFNLQAVPDQKTIRKLVTNLFSKNESKKGDSSQIHDRARPFKLNDNHICNENYNLSDML